MAKASRKQRNISKKHLARIDRERRQSRIIMVASIIVLSLVVIIVGYGILDQYVLQGLSPVATVNGDKITSKEFQSLARYTRYSLIRSALNSYQFAGMFGSDPNTQASFANQVQQIMMQLNDVGVVGQQTIDQLVNDRLIRQQAEEMGITVTSEELDEAVAQAFGYFADGTPTPTASQQVQPTSTLSSQQLTLIPPTATATITPTLTATSTPSQTVTIPAPTATPTATATLLPPTATVNPTPVATALPTATATPYTEDAYLELYAETVKTFEEEYQIPEETIRFVIESQLYRQKMEEAITGDLPCSQEQVWALHILVEDEETAQEVLDRLAAGEEWGPLASEYSIDTSNKDKGGDLGWFGRGQMVAEFEDAAFSLEIGETSDPVETQFGWHIIRVLGHEERPLDPNTCTQMKQQEFQNWLDEVRAESDIEISEDWYGKVPTEPTLPPEIQDWVISVQGSLNSGSGALPGLSLTPAP